MQIKIIAIVLVCFDSPTIADIIKIALIEYNIMSTPINGTRTNAERRAEILERAGDIKGC